MHWPMLVKNLLRVTLTVAIVVAIAAAVLVLHPDSDDEGGVGVGASRADIAWMTPFEQTHTQRFASALEDLGHEPPRVYDLNGNEVFFSTRTSRKSPERLLQEYQEKFVEKGVNSKMWLQSTDNLSKQRPSKGARNQISERAKAAVDGEILPTAANDRYMAMNGMLMDTGEGDADDEEHLGEVVEKLERTTSQLEKAYAECGGDPDLVDEHSKEQHVPVGMDLDKVDKALEKRSSCDGGGPKVCSEWQHKLETSQQKLQTYAGAVKEQPELLECQAMQRLERSKVQQAGRDFAERIDGFRSIEAFRDRDSGRSVVTASWSDDDFDMTSMMPSHYGLGDQDGDIPLCKSCRRAWNFTGTGSESAYGTDQIWSHDSVDGAAFDYAKTMTEQGWEYGDADTLMTKLYQFMDMPAEAGRWMRFKRGNRQVTLNIKADRDNGRTEITAFSSQ